MSGYHRPVRGRVVVGGVGVEGKEVEDGVGGEGGSVQGTHCTGTTGKTGKMAKKKHPCQGKHREFGNVAKTLGI